MIRDRHRFIASRVAQAERLMDAERAFLMLGFCRELLRALEPHLEPEQRQLPLEAAS